MKFSLISDMHVDFPQRKVPYDLLEKDVVVAGDTSNGLEGLKFLQKLKNKGFNVYAVDGNHEHYANTAQGRTVEETTARFREDHRRYHDLEPTPIVLANGWYPVTDEEIWADYMNDSRKGNLSATEANVRSLNDASFIEETLKGWRDIQKKGIVVTHTAPCEETLDERYFGFFSNEWYWNPQMRRLLTEYKDQIHVWCHGHTHASADKIVDGVRVVCNPRGYPGENPNWKPLTVEIKDVQDMAVRRPPLLP